MSNPTDLTDNQVLTLASDIRARRKNEWRQAQFVELDFVTVRWDNAPMSHSNKLSGKFYESYTSVVLPARDVSEGINYHYNKVIQEWRA